MGGHLVAEGFGDWKNAQRLDNRVTSSNSHIDCVHMGYGLVNSNHCITVAFVNQMKKMNVKYCVCVNRYRLVVDYMKNHMFLANDTRWDSHFRTITSLMTLYGVINVVLEEVRKDTSFKKYGEIMLLLDVLLSFDFNFMVYMKVEI
ncbi:uncharacterized protein LOC131605366 [Vicia villosa]|uniref:uncharacterized protein LOC131605366 n=1 Tax=Vicia villosa TaxID=3911 RepID=UPI00273AC341|nr:uncharacterized protein LOC131605366 [Vicia villosa]